MVRVCVLVALLSGVALAKPKSTPKPPPPPPAASDTPDQPAPGVAHGEGEYGGVVPGQPQKSDSKKPKRPPPKGTLAWIGFETKDGGSQVFFQSVAPFDLAQRVENGVLVVHLTGLSRLGQNTWRPIDTRFFATPVARIVARLGARGKKPGIDVRITFKNAKDAKEGTFRSATEADGMYYAYLEFGGGPAPEPTLSEPEQ